MGEAKSYPHDYCLGPDVRCAEVYRVWVETILKRAKYLLVVEKNWKLPRQLLSLTFISLYLSPFVPFDSLSTLHPDFDVLGAFL